MDYSSIDLEWNWTGDFAIGKDGDLKDTSDDTIQALVQEIQSIIRSNFKDWKAHPSLAANLAQFRGEANTRETGKRVEQQIFSVLVNNNVVRPEDLTVKVVPIHIHQIAVFLKISALATPQNSLELGQPVVTALIYDSVEDSVFYVPEDQLKREYAFRRA
jgi:hypothetical protein